MVLGQKMNVLADKQLKEDGLTFSQVLVLIAIERGFDSPPSISEITSLLSTSRQNIKQLINQLVKKGFVKMFKDPTDKRVLRVETTIFNQKYWEKRDPEHLLFIDQIFKILSLEEIYDLNKLIDRLYSRVHGLLTD